MKFLILPILLAALLLPLSSNAESQGNDYKGVTDPFGDPANYEFAEDEREDKEFFHLGRYLMFGMKLGAGIFTGGLGTTVSPGLLIGADLNYFFDRTFSLEISGTYSNHLDQVRIAGAQGFDYDTNLFALNAGIRFYFDTRNAPKAIAVANPYLGIGGGMYIRNQQLNASAGISVQSNVSTSSFGAYGCGGVEFNVYKKHIYFGLDLRYHYVVFPDENQTYNGKLPDGSRAGDYFTTVATITYNF